VIPTPIHVVVTPAATCSVPRQCASRPALMAHQNSGTPTSLTITSSCSN